MNLATVVLNREKDKSIKRFHPWVFSGAIQKIVSDTGEAPEDGELVNVVSNNNQFLGKGFFQDATIAVRVITFFDEAIDQAFWDRKLLEAFEVRKHLGLTDNDTTNMYRLFHGEGDGISGLIIDIYNGTAVIQIHNVGLNNHLNEISSALQKCFQKKLNAIYFKSEESLGKQGYTGVKNRYLFESNSIETTGLEYGCQFNLDWINGQKTGFFLDQRENRKLLGDFSKGKKVLNTFCYSGGFSISALKAGATLVHSVDSSQKAIDLTDQNVALNGFDNHKSFCSDTLQFLKQNEEDYDVIVLDPPAYAKHQKSKHNAIQGYKRINEMALKQIKPGGILFTFSCSQVIHRKMFYDTIIAAAINVGRNVRVLHHLSQPADHPVNIYHPEGEYLKGLVLYVA